MAALKISVDDARSGPEASLFLRPSRRGLHGGPRVRPLAYMALRDFAPKVVGCPLWVESGHSVPLGSRHNSGSRNLGYWLELTVGFPSAPAQTVPWGRHVGCPAAPG